MSGQNIQEQREMSRVCKMRTQMRTFLGCEDIFAGPQNFKGLLRVKRVKTWI